MAVNSNDDARFKVVEYSPEKAEMIGYSNYSYWKSVFHNFLKKKSAVALLIVFVALVVFSFVALVIGKYDYRNLVTDSSKGFILPNSEFCAPPKPPPPSELKPPNYRRACATSQPFPAYASTQ